MTPEEQPDCLRRLRAMSSEEGFDDYSDDEWVNTSRGVIAEYDGLHTLFERVMARGEQLSRLLTNTATPLDAVELLSRVLVEDAENAPNCAEWRGSYGERAFAITVQWVDGKSPHALIDEARRERDEARAQLATIRGALDGTVVPPPGDSLARRVYETAQLATDLRALRAKGTP